MKKHIKLAATILIINLLTYPLLRHLAYLERGHLDASGGELLLFIFGFFVAGAVLVHGWQTKRQQKSSHKLGNLG